MSKTADNIDRYGERPGTCLRDAGRHTEALEQHLEVPALVHDDPSGMTPSVVAFVRPIAPARVGECLGLLGQPAEASSRCRDLANAAP